MLMVKQSLPLYQNEGKKEDVKKVVKKTILFCILLCVSIDLIKILLTWQSSEVSKEIYHGKRVNHKSSLLSWIFEEIPKTFYRKGLVIVDMYEAKGDKKMKRMENKDHQRHSPPSSMEEVNSPKILKVIPTIKRLDENENPENSLLKELPLVIKEKSISPESSSPNSSSERFSRSGFEALKKKPKKSSMKNYNAPIDSKGKKISKRVHFPNSEQKEFSKSSPTK